MHWGAHSGRLLRVDWAILGVLSEDDRRAVLSTARRRRFTRNEVIFHEGDPGDTLHLVAKGFIAIRTTTPLGDVATVRIVKAGEFFGELAVVVPGPRNATAVALDNAETLGLHRNELDGLRATHRDIDRVLIEALVAEVRRLAVQHLDALYLPAEKRFWRRLAELSGIFGGRDSAEPVIPLRQEDLAQVVGTTRPTVNALLQEAEKSGILSIGRGRVQIIDRETLARRAR
jgi:CRP/FNR family transcriptional regulator, cyclic AMP receptor protein